MASSLQSTKTAGPQAAQADMSVTIGGRTVTPALPIVDPNPTTAALEVSFQRLVLESYSSACIPLESKEGIQRRERVLDRMGALCRSWIQSVCRRTGLPRDAGGQLYTSGSYRLGVHEPGADIDTILVAPNVCTREDFFGSAYTPPPDMEHAQHVWRDPESLAERIRRHPDVTNFVPVENAAVPILTFDWEGVNIDLLFARLNSAVVPPTLDIDNDSVLDGVDSATEKSLNGPRVTNLIAALVSGTPQRYQTFLSVVRCVRKWAKARGLYSNKMGYWGGVNINIAVALVIQLYPNACAAIILRKFFFVFKSWRWPNPIMLTKPHDANLGLTVWSAYYVNNMRQVAPIITPAYPAMNSTLSVSRQTLQIMHEEFCRGHDIMDKIWKQHVLRKGVYEEEENPGDVLQELFEHSNFFISYPYYLSMCIVGPTEADAQSWAGFVESRLRKLVSDMLGKSLPLSKIQLWPKKFEACVADKTALLSLAQRRNSITYFIGFHVDTLRMRGNQLNVEQQMQNFRDWELARFQPLLNGMDILVKSFKVKELPRICFEGIYDGGKVAAMQLRRRIRDLDPKRQESKRLTKLAELKAKMAEMQRKKDEKKKRKREEEDDLDETVPYKEEQVDSIVEGDSVSSALNAEEFVTAKEEAALLENALDSIQKDAAAEGGTVIEVAALDMDKLLAGELLADAGEDVDSDEEGGGYGPDGARKPNLGTTAGSPTMAERAPTLAEQEAEILRRSGYTVVSDDEAVIVGGNMIQPWRKPRRFHNDDGGKAEASNNDAAVRRKGIPIKFLTEFDMVELDANGHVIDKGDNDYKPSTRWAGRRPGFEFKLGERGLGYYRTGKKVVVPSNTAY